MTKQIDIKELIPFMKDGWVAMYNDGDWYWHEEEPFTEYEEELNRGCWYNDGQFHSLKAFNIAPAEDWTKSLIQIKGGRTKMSKDITIKIGKRYLTRERRLAFVHTDGSYNGEKIYWYVITGDSTQYFCDEQGKNLGDCCDCRGIDIRDLLENKDA